MSKRVPPIVTVNDTPLVSQLLLDGRVIAVFPPTVSRGDVVLGRSMEARSAARSLRRVLRGYTRLK